MNPIEKQQNFYKELKQLLLKYDAEITIEDFGREYLPKEEIVIDFGYDESLFDDNFTGSIPQLRLGRFEDGR